MARSSKNNAGDYEVGYGKPPKPTQFRKGQSGNPNGRPRKQPTVADAARKALNSKVRVRDGDKVRQITQLEAVFLKQLEKAMKGDPKAAELVLRIAQLVSDKTGQTFQDGADGTELTQETQEQIIADFLELHGVEGGDANDDGPHDEEG